MQTIVHHPFALGARALLFLLLLLLSSALAQETETISLDDVKSGDLLFRSDTAGAYRPATQLATDVAIVVNGMVAQVNVRQTFENTGNDWAEAVYVFPLPETAAVTTLRMRIGERIIVGEVQEKEEAKASYEAAKEAGQRSSLVEQERPNLFTTSVANIGPGETIVIELGYLETLRFDGGSFHLRFPLAITPRYSPGTPLVETVSHSYHPDQAGWAPATDQVPDAPRITPAYLRSEEGLVNPVTLSARIDAGFPLANVESRYHAITREAQGDATLIRLRGEVHATRDFELVWTPDTGHSPGAAVFKEQIEGEDYALVMLMPPQLEHAPEAGPREMILIIDTSGSMSGTSMEQAKAALRLSLERLKSSDRFNIIAFDDRPQQLFRSARAADETNIKLAQRFVRGLQADGGTEMRPALELALQDRGAAGHLRQIVFITDGSVGNETELFKLIGQRLGDSRLFTVGIGSAPNSYFMRKAAEFGRGSFSYIGQLEEVETRMVALFEKLEHPVLTNLRLELPPGSEAFPATVPDLYLSQPVVLSVKLPTARNDAMLRVAGKLGTETWNRSLALTGGGEAAGLAQLWARAKIEELSDEQLRREDIEQFKGAIIKLALKHQLVSAYTSLVAVDKTPARPAEAGLAREDLPHNLPDGQNYDAIFGSQQVGFSNTATPAGVNLLIGIILLALAAYLVTQRRRIGVQA